MTLLDRLNSPKLDFTHNRSGGKINKFQQTFNFPVSERLVNYFACTHGNRPGQIYLSINHISFYSYFLGSELKLVFRWIDVEKIELKTTLVAYAVKEWIKTKDTKFESRLVNFFLRTDFFSSQKGCNKPR